MKKLDRIILNECGQEQTCDLLKLYKGQKFISSQIAKLLNIKNDGIGATLKRLRKRKEIKFKKMQVGSKREIYVYWM